ncbi:hypothetical protein EPO15_18130 [bacterium]|nr:MAG: hypothetical protein EPO15_18130 [bacterium]
MKTLIIGGNRFVGLRLSRLLDRDSGCELHILNRSGQVPGVTKATIHKGSRDDLPASGLDRDWDVVVDFSCYNDAHAKGSIGFFRKVGRYVHISTGSVYDDGRYQTEAGFVPEKWTRHDTPTEEEKKDPYKFGKRQAEAAFAQGAGFPVLLVRIPFIAGLDDYTRRFAFHVERIAKALPIYVPNLEARSSFADSEDAARFLHWCLDKDLVGPVNVASPADISLKDLLAFIEGRLGRKARLAAEATEENHSPYGIAETRTMDVGRMKAAGFATRPLEEWLPGLIDGLKI